MMVRTRACASSFKSKVPRFEQSSNSASESRVLVYSDQGTIEKSVVGSPLKYSHFRSVVPRLRYGEVVDDPAYETDAGNKSSLVRQVQTSPRRLRAVFNDAPRFPNLRLPLDMVYETDTALVKPSVSKEVETSQRRYSMMTTITPREGLDSGRDQFPSYNPKGGTMEDDLAHTHYRYAIVSSKAPRAPLPKSCVGTVEYDPDYGPKASLARLVEEAGSNTVPFRSAQGRFGPVVGSLGFGAGSGTAGLPAAERVYEIDSGHKMSLWKSVQESPRLLSNFREGGGGPQPPKSARNAPTNGVRETIYNTDAGEKMTMATQLQHTPRVFSTLQSATPRFPSERAAGCDNFYNTDCGVKLSISRTVENSPRRVSTVCTTTPRFKEPPTDGDTDAIYDTDCGKNLTLAKSVQDSNIRYSNVRSVIPRFRQERRTTMEDEYEALLHNPGKIGLRFEIRGNTVVKKTSERAVIIVGRQ